MQRSQNSRGPRGLLDIISRGQLSLLRARGPGGWDDDGPDGPGLLKTLEAIEGVVIPFLILKQPELVPDGFETILAKDLEQVVHLAQRTGWPPSPYLDQSISNKFKQEQIRIEPKDMSCVDAASFLITGLVDSVQYLVERGANSSDGLVPRELDGLLARVVTWLIQNVQMDTDGRTACWGWGPSAASFASAYFSYSATVALGAVCAATQSVLDLLPETSATVPRAHELLLQGALWFDRHTTPLGASESDVGLRFVDSERTESLSDARGFLPYTLLAIEAAVNAGIPHTEFPKLLAAGTTLCSMVETGAHEELFEGNTHWIEIKGRRFPYPDRSLHYAALAATAWFQSVVCSVDHALAVRAVNASMRLVSFVLRERDDVACHWTGSSFEIYRTQRALEALCYAVTYLDATTLHTLEATSAPQERIERALREALADPGILRALLKAVLDAIDAER